MDQVTAAVEPTLASLDEVANKSFLTIPQVKEMQENAQVRPAYIVVAAGALAGLILYLVLDFDVICNLIGFFYPVYASFKALATPENPDASQWLSYWIVYSFAILTESVTDVILGWLPFYSLFKLAFYVYLMHPATKGAKKIYEAALKPAFVSMVATKEE